MIAVDGTSVSLPNSYLENFNLEGADDRRWGLLELVSVVIKETPRSCLLMLTALGHNGRTSSLRQMINLLVMSCHLAVPAPRTLRDKIL